MVRLIRLLAAALVALPAACDRGPEPARVSLAEREKVAPRPAPSGAAPLRFAVGAMLTPQEGFRQYSRLVERVERLLQRDVKLVDRPSYALVNQGLERGEIDLAFVCSGPYVQGHERFGLELLAVPVANGTPTYRSYVIVPAASPARRFEDLRGRRFAFTDPDSNTGRLVPTHWLRERGERPETFFARTTLTGSHDQSIRAVAERVVDGAAVDSLIWEYVARTNPALAARTRIVWTSEPFGIPPLVVRPGIDPALRDRLRAIFLGFHAEPEGRAILAEIGIERFVAGSDADYDSIRRMQAALAKGGAGAAP